MNSDSSRVVIIALVIAGLLGGGAWWWKASQKTPVVATVATVPSVPPAPSPVVPALPEAPPPPEPAVRHPVPKAAGGEALPALDQSDGFARSQLMELLGRRAIQTFLVNEGILRKVVATVDSLGRDHSPSEMWPVVPTPGRFQSQSADNGAVLSADNAARYTPLVSLAAGVDARRLVVLYHRLYPRLQQAYEEVGYPDKYFNDRVVEIIDVLLATPDAEQPIPLKAVEVPGAAPNKKPSLYLFADPAMEARPMGQKVLLRMGRANAARVKEKLAEIRKLIASDGTGAARSK